MNTSRPADHRPRRVVQAWLLVLSLAPWLPGCKVGPDYVPPEPDMPDAWHQELLQGLTEGEADLRTWWTRFQDPVLEAWIQRSATGNLDLKQAMARIREARALVGVSSGEWFPDIDGVGAYDRTRISEAVFPSTLPGVDREQNFYRLGADASWEIDVWGRIARSVEAAEASLQANLEAYRDILVILYAEVAIGYIEARSLQARIRIANENVESQRAMLQLVRDRNTAGLVPPLDVHQAELIVASTESVIPALETLLSRTLNRLGVLLGEQPGGLGAELAAAVAVPEPPGSVLVGLPAELLRQRPDVRRAERELAAQTARIGVATAELYPRFSLFGTWALESVGSRDFFESSSRAWSVGPSVRWNLFDGGRVRSNIKAEDARTQLALFRYEQTVLFALEDVENSLVSFVREIERRDALRRAVTAAGESVDQVEELYRQGLVNHQNVLDMQRSLFAEQDRLAESEGIVIQNLIRIYRAFGGGWSESPEQDSDSGDR